MTFVTWDELVKNCISEKVKNMGIAEKLEVKREKAILKDMRQRIKMMKGYWKTEEGIRIEIERLIRDIDNELKKEIEYMERLLKGRI